MKGSITVVIWTIFGLLITVAAVIIIANLSDTAQSNLCWGGAITQMGAIQRGFNALPNVGDSTAVFVNLEGCVDGLAFINQKEFSSVFTGAGLYTADYIECPQDYPADIIAVPRIPDTPGFFAGFGDSLGGDNENLKKWAVGYAREKTNIRAKPICKNVPAKKAIFDRPFIKQNSLSGGKYCITIRRLEEFKYTILSFDSVESERQCKKPEPAVG